MCAQSAPVCWRPLCDFIGIFRLSWRFETLVALENGPLQRKELDAAIADAPARSLSKVLDDLQAAKLVKRMPFEETTGVAYALTDEGQMLLATMREVCGQCVLIAPVLALAASQTPK